MNHPKVRADFNGVFGNLLCLSHAETCLDEHGAVVHLSDGLTLTAYEEDTDDKGKPDRLLAHGSVEPAPEWLQCNGSKWVLKINSKGVFHESEM